MIVVLGLPLNVAIIILSCIFSMLLSDLGEQRLRSIPTYPEFFHADVEVNVHPLLE